MSFERKPSKPSLVRHKIGAQSSPPAIVLIYSRSDKPEKMRKRVMPLRGLKAFADGQAIAKLMQEAHKEFLDPAHVSVEQLAGLCEKLRCGQAGGAKSAAAPPPPVAPLSRSSSREVECDLPSPSSASGRSSNTSPFGNRWHLCLTPHCQASLSSWTAPQHRYMPEILLPAVRAKLVDLRQRTKVATVRLEV